LLKLSQAYQEAIAGSPRRIELLAVVDISDPDKKILPPTASAEAPWSLLDQVRNYELDTPARMATLERSRWLLDGSFSLFPDNYAVPGEVGYASDAMSGADGRFPSPVWVQLNFEHVRILQGCSVYFTEDPMDGVPADFTVTLYHGETELHTVEIKANREHKVKLRGFTVYNPTAIRLTVTRMSLPFRRLRVVEIIMGLYERWGNGDLHSFSVTLQGQFSCLSIPYGTAALEMDNSERLFEPRRKDFIFESLEERQGIDLYIGARTPQGVERARLGTFYQYADGWKTSSNDLVMKWYLVDIIGLLAGRTFLPPPVLPATLEGWIKAVVSQLGENFADRYHVDPEYARKTVTANSLNDVTGKKCGDIIRWACQTTGTWPRARQEDGALTIEPLWNEGNKYTLDNLNSYPTMKANDSIAALIFRLALPELPPDENGNVPEDTRQKEVVIGGNETSSEKTVTIINPFIHTAAQALEASRLILSQYGGNLYETTGRGDPSSEIGDVDTIWLDESSAASARRMSQTFQIRDGVLRNCKSTLLQASGLSLYTEYAVLTGSGVFTVPDGVTVLRVILVGGGHGGAKGDPGVPASHDERRAYPSEYGQPGAGGSGGKIWTGTVMVNPGDRIEYASGAGGGPAQDGGNTIFSGYSSSAGTVYPNGYTELITGTTYARTGVAAPSPGSGDGGAGGAGGKPETGYWIMDLSKYGDLITYVPGEPVGEGEPGAAGGSGCVVVFWTKQA